MAIKLPREVLEQPENHRLIALPHGFIAKVSIEDYEWASAYLWSRAGWGGYAFNERAGESFGTQYMHKIILEKILGRKLNKGEVSDHIDNDTLNNLRSNLRIATAKQNDFNRSPQRLPNRSSPYKGVTWNKALNKWKVTIQANKTRIYLGHFDDDTDAAVVYDIAAIQLFDDYAWLNLIGK